MLVARVAQVGPVVQAVHAGQGQAVQERLLMDLAVSLERLAFGLEWEPILR